MATPKNALFDFEEEAPILLGLRAAIEPRTGWRDFVVFPPLFGTIAKCPLARLFPFAKGAGLGSVNSGSALRRSGRISMAASKVVPHFLHLSVFPAAWSGSCAEVEHLGQIMFRGMDWCAPTNIPDLGLWANLLVQASSAWNEYMWLASQGRYTPLLPIRLVEFLGIRALFFVSS